MLIQCCRWLTLRALGVAVTCMAVAFLAATFVGAASAQDKGLPLAREKSKDHAYAKGKDKSQDKGKGNDNGHIACPNTNGVPEMDPGSLVGAMSLLSGGALLLASRRKRT